VNPPDRAQWLAVAFVTLGCAGTPAARSSSIPLDGTRREPAVVWPSALREGSAADGVVVLQAPPTGRVARHVVQDFFEAVRRESIRDLDALLSEDATITSGPGSAAEPVPKVWAARFKRLEYGFSGAKHPYRADELGVFTKEELSALRPARAFELSPDEDELLAVVTTRDRRKLSGPRHFGRRIEFVLGPSPSGLQIRRMFEDFRLP
jgi:hypothetical protein